MSREYFNLLFPHLNRGDCTVRKDCEDFFFFFSDEIKLKL